MAAGKKNLKTTHIRSSAQASNRFKRSKNDINSSNQLSTSLLVQDDDPEFPRGGGSILTREEKAEAYAEAEAEFERDSSVFNKGKDKRNTRKKNLDDGGDELGTLFGAGITGRLPKFANRITLKNISPKMKFWGVIVEVNEKDLVVGLPGGLRGYVHEEDASDIVLDNKANDQKDAKVGILSSIFYVGQLVSCTVLRVDDDKKEGNINRRIFLSLCLSLIYNGLTLDAVQEGMVLTAQVKSVEDHGYILHFGVPSFTGFLPRSGEGNSNFCKGQFIHCTVKGMDKARSLVYLNSDFDTVAKYVAKDPKGLSIDLLVPGMMVSARIHSTLQNGIMLSFLTYFTGTADVFNLQSPFLTGSWKDDYKENKKVNARILFIDPSTRAIGLTLNSHLIRYKAPPLHIKIGEIYDGSRILRVDRRFGLLIEVPSSPEPSPAYVSTSDAVDDKGSTNEKKFREGTQLRVRVTGFRYLEGIATGTLKDSALEEGSVYAHSDVKPGMLLKAKVIAVQDFGAIVQCSSGIKALCPVPHMSELEMARPSKKFKVGAELLFRVLGCKSKRITVTYKKTLVKSKLKILASYSDAAEGLVTHGWISKIEKHGCFVKFYNGVEGFAHKSELALDPGSKANDVYHVGQVVKCRVLASVPTSHRVSLSFVISPKRSNVDDDTKIGSVVSGVVERLTDEAIIVCVDNTSSRKGMISKEHLADHNVQAAVLRSLLQPGYKFKELLVLDIDGQTLVLSAKHSLICNYQDIPSNVSQISSFSVVHGYICNVTEAGCFVRFLGRLTGFSPKEIVSDGKFDNLLDAFYVGQSVRSHILHVSNETGRIKLCLKQSLCFSTNSLFIRSYFSVDEKIAELQNSNVKSLTIGTLVKGEVQERKDFGIVLSFKEYPDVVGFVANHHLGEAAVEKGSTVRAFIMDISNTEGVVDLSLKREFTDNKKVKSSSKKKRQRTTADLELGETVTAVVEMIKDNYLVLSIPEKNYAIGYASIMDYNTQKLSPRKFDLGQSVIVTVGELPNLDSCNRLLLLIKHTMDASSSKRARKFSSYAIGSLVDAEVIDIKPLELVVKFGHGARGRIHITEVTDDDGDKNPLANFNVGQIINARIVDYGSKSRKQATGYEWELSLRNPESEEDTNMESKFSAGNIVKGYVVEVGAEWLWLTVSRKVRAQLYILDSSCEPSELQEFQKRYSVGQLVRGHVLKLNKEKKTIRITPYLPSPNDDVSDASGVHNIKEGYIIGGKIIQIRPGVGGLVVRIGPHLHGRVHYTELVDDWVPHPLSGYKNGQFVKCKVLEASKSSDGLHIDLSLRESQIGDSTVPIDKISSFQRATNVDNLQPKMEIKGYVTNITSKGCFVMLSRKLDARIRISDLSDSFIEIPGKEFPVGSLVQGRVLSIDSSSQKVNLTLKREVDSETTNLDAFINLKVGEIVSGVVKGVEAYGVFIRIDQTNLVGLCHISEASDEHIVNIEDIYTKGDKVVAKILQVDKERHRISLGMKKSYVVNADTDNGSDADSDSDTNNLNNVSGNIENDEDNYEALCTYFDNSDNDVDTHVVPLPAESRSSINPLPVKVDDSEGSDVDDGAQNQNVNTEQVTVLKKSDKREKKKAKEQRELEIRAAEERMLRKEVPQSEDEYEKLVRASPNSSYVWVKFMAFMETVGDIDKARSVAERALRTINFREENEKLNIWTAYFNLELRYGNPPEEAVKKVFARAMQSLDHKKVYFALIEVYERALRYNLAEEIYRRMSKEYKTSCKVWLHQVESLLKQKKESKDIDAIVARAILHLSRKKQIKFISRYAILEFKCGEPERGRTKFEEMLRDSPKRTDLWSVYIDQEIRLGDQEVIRALFERVTSLSLPPKKIEFLFKKYLSYEKSQGDEDRIEYVKKKAVEYAQSL